MRQLSRGKGLQRQAAESEAVPAATVWSSTWTKLHNYYICAEDLGQSLIGFLAVSSVCVSPYGPKLVDSVFVLAVSLTILPPSLLSPPPPQDSPRSTSCSAAEALHQFLPAAR